MQRLLSNYLYNFKIYIIIAFLNILRILLINFCLELKLIHFVTVKMSDYSISSIIITVSSLIFNIHRILITTSFITAKIDSEEWEHNSCDILETR